MNDLIGKSIKEGMLLGLNSALNSLESLRIEKALEYIRKHRDRIANEIGDSKNEIIYGHPVDPLTGMDNKEVLHNINERNT